jgi:hypothetical protein
VNQQCFPDTATVAFIMDGEAEIGQGSKKAVMSLDPVFTSRTNREIRCGKSSKEGGVNL